MRSELTVDIEIFDINWLADKFTEFYPEFFFEGEVMDFLQKKTSELEEKHRRDKDGSNLSDFFVNPLIRPLGTPFEFDEKGLRTLFEKRKYSFSRLLEITKKRDKLILLGDPGTGKTGATAKLAIDMYRDAYNQLLLKPGKNTQEIPIPVHVSARNFIEAESLDRFLTNYFNSAETRKHFKIDLIIVDGLDEIESEKRETFMDKLDEFSEEVGSSYILTSRKIDFLTTLSEKYEKYELLPFEFNQAVEFISNLISDSNTLDYMKDRLDKIKMQLFLVPLSLMLLVDLVEEKKEVPASLTELYDRFFDMVFGREAQDKGIEVLFDYVIKKRFLGELAYHEYLCNNKFELSDKDFRQFLDSYMQKYGLEIDNVNHFIREIERAGIIDIKDNVIFKHRSYLDYFAAFHIHENRETFENLNDFIVDIYFNEIWSEVAFFYIGLHRNISQDLIEKILKHNGDGINILISKLLSGRLLQAGWYSPVEQHVIGINEAIQFAPQVQKHLQEIVSSADSHIPQYKCDYLVLLLCDLSFNSGFLEKQIKPIIESLINSDSVDDIFMAISLLWSIRRFLNPDDVRKIIEQIMKPLNTLIDSEQARLVLLLSMIEEDDKEIQRLIGRHIRKIIKRSPHVFKALLPLKRKGFRT